MEKIKEYIPDGAIHGWFELTYTSYLILPRTALQSMPLEWQDRFVQCPEEMENKFKRIPERGTYYAQLKDDNGRFLHDPLANYERGRRRI